MPDADLTPGAGPAAEPGLEVIIVSHGAERLLRRCLSSLAENPPSREMRVTVVDSGSTDSTPDMVEREFPEVHLVRQDNIGFSAANNLILAESEAPALLLLNPDTEVSAGALDACLDRLEGDPAIGMVGCRLVTESGELDHACKRSFPTPIGAVAHFTGMGRIPGAPKALTQYRATDLDDASTLGVTGGGDEVQEYVADGDGLTQRAHPARRDHHRQVLDETPQELEAGAA